MRRWRCHRNPRGPRHADIHFHMAYCPNCRAPIAQDAQDCDVCGTSFGPDTWLPLDSLPALHTGRSRRRKTALFAGLVLALGLPALLWWRVGEAALEALAYIVPAIALVAATALLLTRGRF
ncbi:MAG: hypothetical protein ACK4MJ_01290 [Hylemonella sp.]